MSEISALPANIVEWLKGREELADIRFLTEFPAIKKAVPLRHTTVAVGIESMEIVDSFTENDEGVLIENEYCRQAKIKLRLSIHAPYSSGGEECHDAFTDIIDCLTFASGLDILYSGCEDIISDRDTDAFVLSAWAMVNASLCPAATSSMDFPSFITKDLLCGSHMQNTDIHLSAEQKTKLDTPYETGSYFGTGNGTRSISLGYKPSFVVVFINGLSPVDIDFINGESYAISAVGFDGAATLGLELTNTGFKVKTSTTSVKGCYPNLNELGTTYRYIAYR
ncbi:MAG: hypothetical protein E7547_00580 [Ruminococcaceae bacterium]|nr:hypothetical protein [Oscillospiraceae bacterium]